MRRTILCLSVLVPMLSGARACVAQSAGDSVLVVLDAWDSLMGAPPWSHPAGHASRICLDGNPFAAAGGNDSTALDGLLRGVRSAFEERFDVKVEDACQSDTADTYGSWIMTPAREPAIIAHFGIPQFNADGTGEITIGNVRAGRWGVFKLCHLVRQDSIWRVARCDTQMML